MGRKIMTDLEKIAKLNYKVSVLRIEKEALLNRNDRLQTKANALQNEVEALKVELRQIWAERDHAINDYRRIVCGPFGDNRNEHTINNHANNNLVSSCQNYASANIKAQHDGLEYYRNLQNQYHADQKKIYAERMAMGGALFP